MAPSSTSEIYPYLFYLILVESIFVQISHSIVIIYNSKTLYWVFMDLYKKQIYISPILIFHSILWIIIAISTLFHNTYVLALWRPNSIIYDPKYFYLSAMIYFCFMPAAAVSLLFSTLERCFIFAIFNRTKLQKIQRFIFWLNIIFVLAVIGFMIEAVITSTPNPFPEKTPNFSPSAMSKESSIESRRNILRLINSGFNFIAFGILSILLKKTKFLSTLKNQRDMAFLVQKILLIHTLLDLFIQGVAFTVLLMTGQSANNILGSYSRTLSALDGLICCLTFVHSINKIRKRNAISIQSNNSSTTKKSVPTKKVLTPNVT